MGDRPDGRGIVTADEFTALAQLLRLRGGPAQECARMVLVDGLAVPDAARRAGLSANAAYNAVARAREGCALARAACGLDN